LAPPLLHILFSPSAAGQLRTAFKKLGRSDRVIALFDDLSFGPIDPPDSNLRATWVDEELGWTDWARVGLEDQPFWSTALSDYPRRIVWVSRRSANEFSGFLELIWRLGDLPCDVVDLTDRGYASSRLGIIGEPIRTFGQVTAEEIIENDFIANLQNLSEEARRAYHDLWRGLRQENAALRIIGPDGQLRSAPITFFDDQLVSCMRLGQWMPAARVVGEVLGSFIDTGLYQVGDLVLAGRLATLADEGRIEAMGELPQLQGSQVRLPGG